MILSYDNMCYVNNLKVARHPLPLPGDLQYIWQDMRSVIDELHIHTHKDPRCQQYSFDKIKASHPDYNTMSREQTFTWLSRYKKILCAMGKLIFTFRMVKHRNLYFS